MQNYPRETLDLVQSLVDKQVSQRKMPAQTGLTIHQLREIFKILAVPKKSRGKRAITAAYETERCCIDCEQIKPISAYTQHSMLHRDGSPRISYATKCNDCQNTFYPSSITPEIEAEILHYRSLGYGKYPISVKLNIVLKHITKYYKAKNIIGSPPKPANGTKCILCDIPNQSSVCSDCNKAYQASKIKPTKPIPPPKEYKNYANRLNDPTLLDLANDIIKIVSRVLRSAGYHRGRKDVFEYIGYTPQQLFNHIDGLLDKSWMTWENRTTNKRIIWDNNDKSTWTWKIRQKEKTPYSSLEDPNFAKTWALDNLQPMPLLPAPKLDRPYPNKSSNLLTHEDEQKIILLKQQGYGSRKQAAIFDVDRSTIQNAFKRLGIDNIYIPPTRKPIPSEKQCIGCHKIKPIDRYRQRIGQFADGTERIAYEARCFECEAEQATKRYNFLLQTNQTAKLRSVISFTLWYAIKNLDHNTETLNFLPFTIQEFVVHFDSLFEDWMSWDNWGRYKKETWDDNNKDTWVWNIDHIIPHSTFHYKSFEDEEFKKCWTLSNLRPYSAKQNVVEGSRRTRHKQEI